MIMNNLNNYFIYNNYRSEDNPDIQKRNAKIKKNQIKAIINKPTINNNKINQNNYFNKYTNRNQNKSDKIKNNIQTLNLQNNRNNTMLVYDKQNKFPNNNNKLVNNQINDPEINLFREKKKYNIPNFKYIKNQNQHNNYGNIDVNNNNLPNTSRNTNNNILHNDLNYTDVNDINNLTPQMNNLNLKYLRDKETRRNYQNKLPVKSISNLNANMINLNKKYFEINQNNNNKIYNIKKQYNHNYMSHNQNERNFRTNFHSTKKMRYNQRSKEDYQRKFELLKKEINELYDKMQKVNYINDINLNNLTYQKELLKNDFPNSIDNFINDNNIDDEQNQ